MNQQNNQYEEAKSRMLQSVREGSVSIEFAKTIFPDICIDDDYERIRKCIRTIIQIKKEGSFGLECNLGATWDEILTWLEEQRKVESDIIEIPGKEGGNDAIWCVNALRIRTDGQNNLMKRCESAKKWLCEIMKKLYKE